MKFSRWRVAFVAALAGSGCLAGAHFLSQSRSLLERATPVSLVPADTLSFDYQWCDGRRLVSRGRGDLWEVDTRTGRRRRLVLGRNWMVVPGGWKISPNGRRVLYQQFKRVSPDQARGAWVAARLPVAGAGTPVPPPGTVLSRSHSASFVSLHGWAWMSDSRHWIQIGGGNRADQLSVMVRSIDAPTRARVVPLGTVPTTPFNMGVGLLGATPRGSIVFAMRPRLSGIGGDQNIWEYQLDPAMTRVVACHRYIICLSEYTATTDMVLSPNGRRIAWRRRESEQWPPRALVGLLRRLPGVAMMPVKVRAVETVWVSDLDGKRMRSVGKISANRRHPFDPAGLRWTPDGQRLSFTYGNVFYTIAAPGK